MCKNKYFVTGDAKQILSFEVCFNWLKITQTSVTTEAKVTIIVTWPISVGIVYILPHKAIRCCTAAPATEAVGVTGACAYATDYVTYTIPPNHIRTAASIRTVVNCLRTTHSFNRRNCFVRLMLLYKKLTMMISGKKIYCVNGKTPNFISRFNVIFKQSNPIRLSVLNNLYKKSRFQES